MIKTNQKIIKRFNQGYTLIELLLYFALVSLMFVQLSSLFLSILEAKSQSQALSAVERDGQFILARLAYDIKRSANIVQPLLLGENSPTAKLIIEGVNYTYVVDDGQLVLIVEDQHQPLNFDTQISNFSIQRLGNPGGKHALKISYTVTSPIVQNTGFESREFQTTIGMR